MKAFSKGFSRPRRVGVCFDSSGVALAFGLSRRRGAAVFRRARVAAHGGSFPSCAGAYRDALAALIAERNATGAKCTVSLPTARCRVQWETLTGAGLRELRAAARRSAFWRARLGVDLESHCAWWWFTRVAGGPGIGALLCAAPREEVAVYVDAVQAAGLAACAVGVSCFDYFGGEFSPELSRVTLILDCDDACLLSSGAFGLRAHGVEFSTRDADALQGEESEFRDGVVNSLAVCVRRSVEHERSAARSRAEVRVIAARGLHGDWLQSLQARLPGFAVELVDGWAAAGVPPPDDHARDEPWRLPRAAARLVAKPRRMRGWTRTVFVPAVNFADRRGDDVRRRRYSALALFSAACLLSVGAGYVHWTLFEEYRRLQPGAEEHARLLQLRDRTRAELETLRSKLSNRILFYSSIQRVSFERKLMPRLLALIEHATLEGVWLNEVHFRRSESLRIVGKSLSDERIFGFIRRLRAADEIVEVSLESAALEADGGTGAPAGAGRLKDFIVTCRLRDSGGRS